MAQQKEQEWMKDLKHEEQLYAIQQPQQDPQGKDEETWL